MLETSLPSFNAAPPFRVLPCWPSRRVGEESFFCGCWTSKVSAIVEAASLILVDDERDAKVSLRRDACRTWMVR
jgi:hypothetical protein